MQPRAALELVRTRLLSLELARLVLPSHSVFNLFLRVVPFAASSPNFVKLLIGLEDMTAKRHSKECPLVDEFSFRFLFLHGTLVIISAYLKSVCRRTASPCNALQFSSINLDIYPTIYQIYQIVLQICAVGMGQPQINALL